MKTNYGLARSASPARQRGVALIFGMIILLILTIIGITAVRSTTQQERMAAAGQQQAQTFEAAESAIQLVMAQLTGSTGAPAPAFALPLKTAVEYGMNPQGSPEPAIPTLSLSGTSTTGPANSTVPMAMTGTTGPGLAADSKVTTTAQIYWVNTSCPGFSGTNLNKFSPFGFNIDVTATDISGAATRNIQQICYLAPKTAA